jgi:hypothetical protein
MVFDRFAELADDFDSFIVQFVCVTVTEKSPALLMLRMS